MRFLVVCLSVPLATAAGLGVIHHLERQDTVTAAFMFALCAGWTLVAATALRRKADEAS